MYYTPPNVIAFVCGSGSFLTPILDLLTGNPPFEERAA